MIFLQELLLILAFAFLCNFEKYSWFFSQSLSPSFWCVLIFRSEHARQFHDYILNLLYFLLTEATKAILIKAMLTQNSLPHLGGLLASLVIDQIFILFDLWKYLFQFMTHRLQMSICNIQVWGKICNLFSGRRTVCASPKACPKWFSVRNRSLWKGIHLWI